MKSAFKKQGEEILQLIAWVILNNLLFFIQLKIIN